MGVAVFPALYSVLSGSALIDEVLARYRLEKIVACRFWHRGLSDVYAIETDSSQYILRISHTHWRTKADIDFELELLDFLQRRHVPVSHPLRTKEGDLAIEINAPEGKRYAALFARAPGEVALGGLNQTQSYKLGEAVAKLHLNALEFRSHACRQPLSLDYLLDDSLQIIAPFLHEKSLDLSYLSEIISLTKSQLQGFPKEPPFWGICWGDPHSGNVHFTADNQLTLFDFDQCGYGWRMFEIAKFWQVSLNSGVSATVRSAFISGYQSVATLTEAEINSLQAFTVVAHIWAWAIALNNATFYNYSCLDDNYFRCRLNRLKMLQSPEWQLF
jgi:Ser/Thr protein kinase RdoA (MazF antagonist)